MANVFALQLVCCDRSGLKTHQSVALHEGVYFSEAAAERQCAVLNAELDIARYYTPDGLIPITYSTLAIALNDEPPTAKSQQVPVGAAVRIIRSVCPEYSAAEIRSRLVPQPRTVTVHRAVGALSDLKTKAPTRRRRVIRVA